MGTALLQLTATLLVCAMLCVAISKRKLPRLQYYTFLSLSIFLYCLGYLFELTGGGQDAALLGFRLQQAALPFVASLYFLFVLEYFDHAPRKRAPIILILAPAALFAVVMLGMGVFPLGWAYPSAVYHAQPFPYVEAPHGALGLAAIVYAGAFLLLGLVYVGWNFIGRGREMRRQSLALLLASLLPAVMLALRVLGVFRQSYDLSSLAMALALVLIGLYILRIRMVNWNSYARESVLESMDDAFILLDKRNHFLDANASALRYFPRLKGLRAGASISRVRDFPQELLKPGATNCEFKVQAGETAQYLRASRSEIKVGDRAVCHCIMIYDITEISKLMRVLNDLAAHDSMTGLLNRRAFFGFAERDFSLALRNAAPLSMLMIDLDFFKKINDQYGHQCGDEVLIVVSGLIKKRLRATDLAGRYGGEEFCVLLPNTSRKGAESIAESLRKEIAARQFNWEGTAFSVTVSIGIAVLLREKHGKLEQLINDADGALYRAKESGRNRVEIAE